VTVRSEFQSGRIERELNFYVATHPLYPINHFYVGATKLDHGQLLQALVYWKEERVLLDYNELEAGSSRDIFAWGPHEAKLNRDTVDKPEEVAGSNYLMTHREWVDLMEHCVSNGKLYCVSAADAQRMFSKDGKPSK
jgi:hypothetical protein